MNKAVVDFADILERGDDIIFYYSGHGLSYDGFHCLLPTDFDGDERTVKDETLNFVTLLEKISNTEPNFKIFLFDCCRSRPFEKIQTKGKNKKATFSNINSSNHGTNIMIASSTAESTESIGDIDNRGLSLWTSHLVEELEKDDVNFPDCLMDVRNKILDGGYPQIPWESSSLRKKFKF